MPAQGDGRQAGVRPPPIWRYDPQQSPLISARIPTPAPAPGFFASQSEQPGPYNRLRPYFRYDGPLLSPGAPAVAATPISASDATAAADAATNILLAGIADAGAGADLATNILLATAAETGGGADAATNILLGNAGEIGDAAAASDLGTNVLLAGIGDAAATADVGTAIANCQPGFFASQQDQPGPYNRLRPYYRYDGPLVSAPAIIGQATPISGSDASVGADAAINILLGAAGEVGDSSTSADAATLIAITAAESASAIDAAPALALAGAGETATGADAATNILLAAIAEAAAAADLGSLVVLSLGIFPGFFSSQSEEPGPYNRLRPYWLYRGALVSAAAAQPSLGLGLTFRIDSLEPSATVLSTQPGSGISSSEPAIGVPSVEPSAVVSSLEPIGSVSTLVRGQ